MDFTVTKYHSLLQALQEAGYRFCTFRRFMEEGQPDRSVVLRHDVDRLPGNALRLARLETGMEVEATYYFRIVPQSFQPEMIRRIAGMGHEIGYHYEDLSLMAGRLKKSGIAPTTPVGMPDLFGQAILHFERSLEMLRQLAEIRTICMHGSPLSRWDNRKLWESYDYRDYGIIAEPYFDVDYSRVLYVTDTGRSWKNREANVRDRVDSPFDHRIGSTPHFIRLLRQGALPGRLMINTHPQRWHPPGIPWGKELVWQNIKNAGKFFVVRMRPS